MRKIVAGFASSLDGYIEGADGEFDWILIDEEIDFAEQMQRFDAFLYGRKSYEVALKMGTKESPGISHYVCSNTLTSVHQHFTLITGSVPEQILELKRQPGKDMAVFGGASLLASLLEMRVVDEIIVSVIPVLLGKGKPMVGVLQEKVWLHLQKSKMYKNGTVQLFYTVQYR